MAIRPQKKFHLRKFSFKACRIPCILIVPNEMEAPTIAPPLIILTASVVLLLFLILKLRIQAFLALIIASLAVAIGSLLIGGTLSLTEIPETIVDKMGSSLGFIALVIGVGGILGAILEHSGGTEALARTLLRAFGEKRASWAMLLTGFIISIPVFLDVALVILAPVLYALARDTKKSILYFGLPLLAGMAVTHAFVPPTPGPVWVAYELGVGLGWVILLGVAVGLPTAIIAGPLLTPYLIKGIHVELPSHLVADSDKNQKRPLPPFWMIVFIISVPLVLIVAGTVVEQSLISGLEPGLTRAENKAALAEQLKTAPQTLQVIHFFGHPVVALLVTTLTALYFLGVRRGATRDELMAISTRSLGPAGLIILITGAGGVYKGMLKATGIDQALLEVFKDSHIPIIVLAYIFATLLRVAQGSATVAMVTAAGLIASLTESLSQPQLALVVIAIAAGATAVSHVNDSGFWIISRYLGMTEKQTLRSWTITSTVISVTGFVFALLLSFFF